MLKVVYAECKYPSSLSLPSPHADPIYRRKTYSGISVHVSLHEYSFIENQIFMLYKVTAVLRARIFSVADVMLDSLEGLVSIFILAMHCNNTNNFAATCINDMVIVAARQDPQSRYLSRRCRGRVCLPPRQWAAYRHLWPPPATQPNVLWPTKLSGKSIVHLLLNYPRAFPLPRRGMLACLEPIC